MSNTHTCDSSSSGCLGAPAWGCVCGTALHPNAVLNLLTALCVITVYYLIGIHVIIILDYLTCSDLNF